MRSTLLLILLISCTLYTTAQYNQLDTATTKKLGLYRVTEITTIIDSLNHTIDTSIKKFIYNRAGELIERDHDFSADRSQYISVKYTYNEKGFISDSLEYNPYFYITRDITEPPVSTAYFYGDGGKVKTCISKWQSGAIEDSEYGYDDQGLLLYIEGTSNIKICTEIRFEYTFYGQ